MSNTNNKYNGTVCILIGVALYSCQFFCYG